MLPTYVKRQIVAGAKFPETARYTFRLDTFGIDSEHDYDPVWERCQELGVAATFHSPGEGWGSRTSISNFVYNHIGHFGAAGEATAKSLFMGGVTHRFPKLKFLFLEGGVGWARSLLSDLVGHWEKRNLREVAKYDPRNRRPRAADRFVPSLWRQAFPRRRSSAREAAQFARNAEDPSMVDDFSRCAIERKEDVRDQLRAQLLFRLRSRRSDHRWRFRQPNAIRSGRASM